MARKLLQFEHHKQPLATREQYRWRVARHGLVAAAIVAAALAIGVVGYKTTERMSWIDAFANASMILSGMGPLTPLNTNAGKIFASFYALCSGLIIVFSTSILLAPVVHRILHNFHVEERHETSDV